VALETFAGPERFVQSGRWIEAQLSRVVAIGAMHLEGAGPRFFCASTFADPALDAAPFAPTTVFLPRWQVVRSELHSLAVANVAVTPDVRLSQLAHRVFAAHQKFGTFAYRKVPPAASGPFVVSDVGEPDHFERAVATALERIEAGRYEKIVLARALDIAATQVFEPLQTLNQLRQQFPNCHAFSVANGQGQSFIGVTPERLFAKHGDRIITEALAGSAPRGGTAAEDAQLARALMESEKDGREHRAVIDAIQRRLAGLGVCLEATSRPRLLPLANVQHLLTPMEGRVPPGCSQFEIETALHPTPAVGGTPRDAAVADIASLEKFERGLYAGSLGWVDCQSNGERVVAIRSALMEGARARLYAGAGIVAGSNPLREKQETTLKLQAMLKALTCGVGRTLG
jgi:menaquinone-specific isochorismate synthase